MPSGIYIRTEENKKRISKALMGHVMSVETRARLSVAGIGNPRRLGSHPSEETKAKISVSLWKGGRQISNAKHTAKHRTLGFSPLNLWFSGCEGHHVDNEQVIYLPQKLHRSIYHRQTDGRGMAAINAVAYNFLFRQEVEAVLAKEANNDNS